MVCDANLDCQLDQIWNQLKAKLLRAKPGRDFLDHLKLFEVERCILNADSIKEVVSSACLHSCQQPIHPVAIAATFFTDMRTQLWASNMDQTEDLQTLSTRLGL